MVRRLKRTFTAERLPDAINRSLEEESTPIPDELLRNPKISAEAKTLFFLLLSYEDNQESHIITIERIIEDLVESEEIIRSSLSELEEHGYLSITALPSTTDDINLKLMNHFGEPHLRLNHGIINTFGIDIALWWADISSRWHYFHKQGKLVDDYYIYVSQEEIRKSTKLNFSKQTAIIKKLASKGIVKVKRKGVPPRNYYKINIIAMSEYTCETNNKPANSQNLLLEGFKNSYQKVIINKNKGNKNNLNLSLKDKSFKSRLHDSSNQKKTSSYDNPEDYSDNVQSLFQHWLGLDIRRHKPSKTRDQALQQLNIYIHRYSIEDITKSMDRYKQLLNDEFSILSDESPYKVGLDEFFGFSRHTKTRIKQSYTKLNGIRSWFEECRKEDLSHLMKVGKNPYPHITQVLKKEFKDRISSINNNTHYENIFRKASRLLMDFHSLNKDKLTIQLQKKPGIFAKCLIEYIESSKSKDGKHPGWLCTDVTWEVFPKWLSEKGYTSEENDTLSNYR